LLLEFTQEARLASKQMIVVFNKSLVLTAIAVSRFVGAKPQQTDAMHLAATHLAATHQAVMADAIRVVVVLVSEAVSKASDAAISAKSGP